jgi:proliferating cell nuclear antigen
MFRTTLVDAKRWRDMLNAVSTIVDEAEFVVTSNGMHLKSFDGSGTAMIDLDLPNSFFDTYICNEPTRLRFKVKTVLNLLENASNESIDVSYSEENTFLVLSLTGDYKRVFNLNTLSLEESAEIEPKVTFNVKAKVLTASLRKVIIDSLKIGDHISIESKENAITFRTNGEGGNAISTFTSGESSILELFIDKESKATYNLDLLGAIVKNTVPISETVKIEYATDLPLRLDFSWSQSKLHFYLSPMLEIS